MSNAQTASKKKSGNGSKQSSISERAADMASSAQDAATAAQEKVKNHAKQAYETGENLIEAGRESFNSVQDDLAQAVRRNPTTALLGAVGVGVLIGMALRHRN